MVPFYQVFQEKYYFFGMGADIVNIWEDVCWGGAGEGWVINGKLGKGLESPETLTVLIGDGH
jgi:hypothetical protein